MIEYSTFVGRNTISRTCPENREGVGEQSEAVHEVTARSHISTLIFTKMEFIILLKNISFFLVFGTIFWIEHWASPFIKFLGECNGRF